MNSGHPVEQAIRRSHCAHAHNLDPQHPCVGNCLITSQGVTLTCKLCGDDERGIAPAETLPESRLLREVLDAIGIEVIYTNSTPQGPEGAHAMRIVL